MWLYRFRADAVRTMRGASRSDCSNLAPRAAAVPGRSSFSDDRFPRVEGLRISARGVALHASQSHQGAKEVLGEPALTVLGWEPFEQVRNLALCVLGVQADEKVRRAQVPVVLGNLELEDHVVAECIPAELG